MREKVVVIVLTLMFLSLGQTAIIVEFNQSLTPDTVRQEHQFSISYTDHAPISIVNDQDFPDQGWPGNGTFIDPYLIDGINVTTTGDCITIQNTRKYFIVSNSLLASDQQTGSGIRILNATYGTVINCSVMTRQYGAYLDRAVNCTIRNNTIIDTSMNGIRVWDCANIILHKNTITDTDADAIYLMHSPQVRVVENDISHTLGSGIGVYAASTECEVRKNIIFDAEQNGIILSADDCIAANNTVILVTWSGIVSYYASDSIITGNEISIVSEYGLWAFVSPRALIQYNTIDNTGGLTIEDGSDQTTVSSNMILYTHWTGMVVASSIDCVIERNLIEDVIADGFLAYWGTMNITVDSNTIRRVGWQGLSFDSSPYAKVSNNLIEDIDENGILCGNHSDHSVFANNIISRTGHHGFDIHHGDYISVSNNIIQDVDNAGISVGSINTITIENNTIDTAANAGIEAGDCDSNLVISGNLLTSMSRYGISIVDCSGTMITGNIVLQSTSYSIQILGSANSQIYLNGFIESTISLFEVMVAPGAIWTNGTHGNFWGNYDGEDGNMDEIGDSPYVLDSIHEDPHPLMDLQPVTALNLLSWEPVSIASLSHEPVAPALNQEVNLTLTVDFELKVSEVVFRYSTDGGTTWTILDSHFESGVWTAVIPPQTEETMVQYEVLIHDIGGTWISSSVQSFMVQEPHSGFPLNPIFLASVILLGTIIIVVGKTVYEIRKRKRLGAWESQM